MGIRARLRSRRRAHSSSSSIKQTRSYLREWVDTRNGVEAFLEPETTVTEPTLVLVAHDGEWTRRRIGHPDAARDLGHTLGIPVYDVALTGYPPRMRAYTNRQKRARRER